MKSFSVSLDLKKYPVPRHRHHLSAEYYLPLNTLNVTPFMYPEPIKTIDWKEIFTNGKSPNALDIGCAFGHFAMRFASLHPELNVLGLEVRGYTIEYIRNVISAENLSNCNALHYNIANGVDFIEDESLDYIFYFFPDPWFKKRHQKRRAFNQQFLALCYAKLKKGGKLLLQTDVDEVHSYHKEELEQFKLFKVNELNNCAEWEFPKTNHEEFCIKKNISFDRLVCEK